MITLGINEASTRVFTSLEWQPLGSIHHKMLFAGSAAGQLGDKRFFRESLNVLPFLSVLFLEKLDE